MSKLILSNAIGPDVRSRRGYDRLAKVYSLIEAIALGRVLQEARLSLLEELGQWDEIAILGGGTGRLLEALCLSNPQGRITSIEHSGRMVDRQRRRLQRIDSIGQVSFVQADALQWKPKPSTLDGLVTPFFLDCFTAEQLALVLPVWLAGLREGGWWYVVDFAETGRLRHRILLGLMHWFFRWQTGLVNRRLVSIAPHLEACGLGCEIQKDFDTGFVLTQIWRLSPKDVACPPKINGGDASGQLGS